MTSAICPISSRRHAKYNHILAEWKRGTFDGSSLIQSAVIRQLAVIGEATKRLSDSLRTEHPDIPWKKIAGMRDIMIHAYDHIDIDAVWNAATRDIPHLIRQIQPLAEFRP